MRVASKWGTFLPNLGTLGLRVLELFATYVKEGRKNKQTDGRTKATLITHFPRGGDIKMPSELMTLYHSDYIVYFQDLSQLYILSHLSLSLSVLRSIT